MYKYDEKTLCRDFTHSLDLIYAFNSYFSSINIQPTWIVLPAVCRRVEAAFKPPKPK